MKKSLFFISPLFVISSLFLPFFTSCEDDEDEETKDQTLPDNNDTESQDLLISKIRMNSTEYATTLTLQYDSKNRLKKMFTNDTSENDEVQYTYDNDKVIINYRAPYDEGLNINSIGVLDKNNRILSETTTNLTEGDKFTLKYSYEDGYLLSKKSDNVDSFEIYYKWVSGNLTHILAAQQFELNAIHGDIPNKTNLDLNKFIHSMVDDTSIFSLFYDFSFLGLTGKKSENMIEKTVFHNFENSNETATHYYKYDLNSNGYIKKVTISDLMGTVCTLDFSYKKAN